MAFDLFVTKAFDPGTRFFFFAWVLVVLVSITLHELAHGWAAMRRGDPTPERLGRMTLNPLVHMGPFSILALLIAGLAWGQMPIDPTRMRGRHAEAAGAAAGPATNLALALIGAVAAGVMIRLGWVGLEDWRGNAVQLMHVLAYGNAVLAAFNLMPAPPLDGSRIVASFHRGFAGFIDDPANQGACMLMFIAVFALSGLLWGPAGVGVECVENWVANIGR